ncbi:hypothetical protein HAX54_024566 [Datura stramonium]|uniref:Uncharacterized protein n=1 Tax=Datura stramonium TaxID=4076 RepID=A0ABS8UY84_DATST|nr:hypothetical protein [Datura stramonium]
MKFRRNGRDRSEGDNPPPLVPKNPKKKVFKLKKKETDLIFWRKSDEILPDGTLEIKVQASIFGEKAGSKGIPTDWDKLFNDDPPAELVVTSALSRLPAEKHQSITMDGEEHKEGLSNLSNIELTEKLARLKRSLSGSIGARLPDGGEKLRANIKLHEDELEWRKRLGSEKV